MQFGASIEETDGDLSHFEFRWDQGTEILSGVTAAVGERGCTGSIELEDEAGAVISLDLKLGLLCGIEVVVWPRTETVESLTPPQPRRQGRMTVPERRSQPGLAVLEADVRLTARRNADETVVHLGLSTAECADVVALADNLLLELDSKGELAGFWLLDVPPFPSDEGRR